MVKTYAKVFKTFVKSDNRRFNPSNNTHKNREVSNPKGEKGKTAFDVNRHHEICSGRLVFCDGSRYGRRLQK
jgi:hypothetical protein